MKHALLTFVYGLGEQFVDEFIKNHSIIKGCDLYFYDFGVSEETNTVLKLNSWQEISSEDSLGLVAARSYCLNFLGCKGYDVVSFIDIDDLTSSDRMDLVKTAYKEYPDCSFYISQLYKFGSDRESYFNFQLPRVFTASSMLEQKNLVGLGHSSLNMKYYKLYKCILRDANVIALDWYLFHALLCFGLCGRVIDGGVYYRIHGNNGSIVENDHNEHSKLINREIEVKKEHYRHMAMLFEEYGLFFQYYENLQEIDVTTVPSTKDSGWWSILQMEKV